MTGRVNRCCTRVLNNDKMRKHQIIQIKEILTTFGEVMNIIIRGGEKHADFCSDANIGVLADIQESIVSLIEFIKECHGENSYTEELLINFYKQIGASVMEKRFGLAQIKELKKCIQAIERNVITEFKIDRIEIAFLSYNASMSDSIESIWEMANADPICDAYWIPVPYYERRPDGSLGKMVYEGQKFYSNIPCTDWREYDFEKRRPDVIFTFAPYDQSNFVTTVHPAFYCERLKNLTDLLCYVPYFVSGNSPLAEHLCIVPGVLYADRVFLESESVKRKYIDAFHKFERDNNCKEFYGRAEDKFVVLGSPKYDKVISTRREDCVLPDEWWDMIGNKKVVLYNTSVSAILSGNEQYLKKLRLVLEIVAKRDDVILWWRPHPLSMATCESMRPSLADEYRRILNEYRNGMFSNPTDVSESSL